MPNENSEISGIWLIIESVINKKPLFSGEIIINNNTYSLAAHKIPKDGERVSSPVTIKFGIKGMDVAPAGTEQANTGHHHLIIDAPLPPFDEPVPADDNYRHFGGGQTEVTLELGPGNHTLQLLLADHNHIPHNPVVHSGRVIISVK